MLPGYFSYPYNVSAYVCTVRGSFSLARLSVFARGCGFSAGWAVATLGRRLKLVCRGDSGAFAHVDPFITANWMGSRCPVLWDTAHRVRVAPARHAAASTHVLRARVATALATKGRHIVSSRSRSAAMGGPGGGPCALTLGASDGPRALRQFNEPSWPAADQDVMPL